MSSYPAALCTSDWKLADTTCRVILVGELGRHGALHGENRDHRNREGTEHEGHDGGDDDQLNQREPLFVSITSTSAQKVRDGARQTAFDRYDSRVAPLRQCPLPRVRGP